MKRTDDMKMPIMGPIYLHGVLIILYVIALLFTTISYNKSGVPKSGISSPFNWIIIVYAFLQHLTMEGILHVEAPLVLVSAFVKFFQIFMAYVLFSGTKINYISFAIYLIFEVALTFIFIVDSKTMKIVEELEDEKEIEEEEESGN